MKQHIYDLKSMHMIYSVHESCSGMDLGTMLERMQPNTLVKRAML